MMIQFLLPLHSLLRWLALLSILFSIVRSVIGYKRNIPFTRADNAMRHWGATIVHLQMMIGILLYSKSPIVSLYWHHITHGGAEGTFFAIIHASMMIVAVVVVTIGSAIAKRKQYDRDKFKMIAIWYSIALLIVLAAIPWPFSVLSSRPYLRLF